MNDMTPQLTSEEFACYVALVASSTLLERAIEKNLHDQAELTLVQFEILMRLADEPDGVRMADLAEKLIVSRSGLSYQVTQLEKAGHLTREKHDADERGIVARITPSGEALRQQVLPGHHALVHESMFADLTPEELAAITSGLSRVADALR